MPLPVGAPAPTRREVLVATALLGALALAVYASHVVRGGWYYDDWAWVAALEFGSRDGVAGVLDAAHAQTHRPLFGVWMSALYAVGGDGQAPYLAAGAALVGVEGALAYVVVRLARLSAALAAPLAALLVVLPVVDSTRLWTAAMPATIAVVLLLAGMAVALVGLGRRGRGAIARHVAALVLYVCAVMSYELVAPVIGLAVVLYAVATRDRRAALRRWSADVVVTLAVLGLMAGAAEKRRDATLEPSFLLDRLEQMADPSWAVLRSLLPFERVLLGPVGILLAVAVAVGAGLAVGQGGRPAQSVRQWASVAAGGVAFAAAGLLMLLPADPYFVPRVSGIGNRTSVVAALGAMALVVAVMWLAGTAVAALARRPAVAAPVAIAALTVIGIGMVQTERRHQHAWAASWIQSQQVVRAIRRAVGSAVAPGTAIVTFHHTLVLPGDVPVFAAEWDLRGAVQLMYDDPTVVGYPWIGHGRCTHRELVLGPEPDPFERLEFGSLFFVDAATDEGIPISSQAQCERALRELGTA